ncbi:hypothetical protein [Romboutsia sp.]|uniref:hypothetical protein n=1 Tax=Romboutsia sp. TaxID=1965302 RepID=UPI002B5E16B0|nr:hypothetical protein [Romboutsia sp.]HSQ87222.1 hypothetical protein [Romboutsia sp.]
MGKSKSNYYFEGFNELRTSTSKNGKENRYVDWIGGPIICFRNEVFEKVKFRDITLGEDQYFLIDSIEKEFKIFIISKFNHILFRSKDSNEHTWKVKHNTLIKASTKI